ncbi:MAG: ABC transporter permease [Oscillospiraceae bacterium]|nr:ABC transporter permease [Oscillospiraceae bacterium]
MSILSTVEVFLETGLVFSIIAMGYYISYHILDFPDLTVEGTFLSGAVIFGLFASKGFNPWLGLFAAVIVGGFFGTVTGVLHVVLKIRPLLCGILVSTSLITVNLIAVSAGTSGDFSGQASTSVSYGRTVKTLHDYFFGDAIPARINNVGLRDLLIFLLVTLICKLLLDLYLKTKSGLLLRAAGNNEQFVKMLGINPGKSKIIGLAVGNACAAVSGALYTHISGNVNQSMGIGTIVIGLASLIIGMSLFGKVKFMKPTTKVIIGSIIYQACLTAAQKLGVPSAYNKLIMAVMFTAAIVLSNREKKKGALKNA